MTIVVKIKFASQRMKLKKSKHCLKLKCHQYCYACCGEVVLVLVLYICCFLTLWCLR